MNTNPNHNASRPDTSFDPNAEAECNGLFGLPCTTLESRVVLVPVPFDATTSFRKGAAEGPRLIREASWQVDLWDNETNNPWKHGIAMMDEPSHIATLNHEARLLLSDEACKKRTSAIDRVNTIGDKVAAWVNQNTQELLRAGKLVGIVGGDHSTPLGAITAIAEHYRSIGVLHIDAHADLRPAFQGLKHSHASIMYNVLHQSERVERITQVALRDLCEMEMHTIRDDCRLISFFDSDMAQALFGGRTLASYMRQVVDTLPENVYVSFDIDGLEPSLCPGTGTPVPGGLSFQQACFLIGEVVRSGRRIVGFDLCEVASGGVHSGIDGIVGARILYKLIGWALVGLDAQKESVAPTN